MRACDKKVIVMNEILEDCYQDSTLIIWIIYNHWKIVNFYAPEIEDRGAYCFCPVCHSVIL